MPVIMLTDTASEVELNAPRGDNYKSLTFTPTQTIACPRRRVLGVSSLLGRKQAVLLRVSFRHVGQVDTRVRVLVPAKLGWMMARRTNRFPVKLSPTA